MNDTRVCQYYLKGHCKYRDNCRLKHDVKSNEELQPAHNNLNNQRNHPRGIRPQPDPRYKFVASSSANDHHPRQPNQFTQFHPTLPSGARQSVQASQMGQSKLDEVISWITENFKNKDQALDLLKYIRREANEWLKSSSLWRFTSRSLFPGGHRLEGWNDQSFEEIKWAHREYTRQNQEHIYKSGYSQYWEQSERQLLALSKLDLAALKQLKPYMDECLASGRTPLINDVKMTDPTDNASSNTVRTSQSQSTSYTPDDQLLPDELDAFRSDTFEFGQIPTHAPSRQFS